MKKEELTVIMHIDYFYATSMLRTHSRLLSSMTNDSP